MFSAGWTELRAQSSRIAMIRQAKLPIGIHIPASPSERDARLENMERGQMHVRKGLCDEQGQNNVKPSSSNAQPSSKGKKYGQPPS